MNNTSPLLNLLSRHVGIRNGISAAQISAALDIHPRRVRSLVSELREEGTAVCGTPTTGYYIAATPEELEETCLFLRHRALHSLKLESKLRKMALEDLVGQLRLGAGS